MKECKICNASNRESLIEISEQNEYSEFYGKIMYRSCTVEYDYDKFERRHFIEMTPEKNPPHRLTACTRIFYCPLCGKELPNN